MTIAAYAAASQPSQTSAAESEYRPGVCNIGPEEIARRRRAGHVGAAVTIGALAVLVLLHLPPVARLVLVLPAAGAAIGYLQATLRFCAGFGGRGVFNFGEVGRTEEVPDPEARARDRARALQIALAGLAIGIAVALAALLLPV
jgi:hypothetical protein